MTISDHARLAKLTVDLKALPPASADTTCTRKAGNTVEVLLTDGTHDATVVVQYSGCGAVANTTDGRLRLGASSLQWVAALSGFSGGGFSGSGG